jgi:hypothetical protein
MKKLSCLVIALAMVASGQGSAADVPNKPSTGRTGYQEIRVGPGIYYVFIEGDSHSTSSDLENAWKARAADLCKGEGRGRFIRLQHLFERVVASDPVMGAVLSAPRFVLAGGGAVYVPVFIPSSNGPSYVDTPTLGAHLRCIEDGAEALFPDRTVSVAAASH